MHAALERALRGETFSERLSIHRHVVDCHFTPQWNSEHDLVGVRGVVLVVDVFADQTARHHPPLDEAAFGKMALPTTMDLINGQSGPLQSLLRYLPDYVLSVVRDGTILFINRTIPPLTFEDVVGSKVYDYLNPNRKADIERFMKQAFETGETVEFEVESDDPDGKRRIYACRLGPFKPAEEVVSLMVIARDVTALREMEDLDRKRQRDLEQLSRVATMGEMVAIMAHYLNNPLAAISNYAHGCIRRLKSEDVTTSQLLEAQQEIVEQCNRASDYIRQLRGFLQKRELHRSETDLTDVIIDAVRLTDPEVRSHDLRVRLDMKIKSPRVYGDALQIEQVLVYLLLNAVDAMKPLHHDKTKPAASDSESTPCREILIQVEAASAKDVTVSVTDCGRGLTPGFEERIFEPFFTTQEKRLGMGLSVSRSIIESHGGRLEGLQNAESGATFRFNLPRCLAGRSYE